MTDNSGVLVNGQNYNYSAFGKLFSGQTASTAATNYQYTGQQFDSLSGLFDLRARYYNPGDGRFLSQDKASYSLSNNIELNRYLYTHDEPVDYKDASGYAAGGIIRSPAGSFNTPQIKTNSSSRLNEYLSILVSVVNIALTSAVVYAAVSNCGVQYWTSVLFAGAKLGAGLLLMENFVEPACMIPVIKFPFPFYPNIGLHIITSQYLLGSPMLLTYLGPNNPQQDINRNLSCTPQRVQQIQAEFGGTKNCDEYPFASTFEGGARSSTWPVFVSENSSQGGKLGAFYRGVGIDNRRHTPLVAGEWFAVVVTPI